MALYQSLGPGHGGNGLRHALAFAGTLKRRCWINGESVMDVCRDLDICWEQAVGAVRMIRHLRGVPSVPRLIAAAMRDWGLDDADLAEMFGCSPEAVAAVRANVGAIRAREPFPDDIEMQCAWILPDDPSPEELAERARSVREARPMQAPPKVRPVRIRTFAWNGVHHAFFPIGAA